MTATCFEENLAFLSAHQPALFYYIQAFSPSEAVSGHFSNGSVSLQAAQADKTWWLYSPHAPEKDAARFLTRISFAHYDYVIVLGLGLGYVPEMILQHNPHLKKLFIMELDPGLVRLAMTFRDLRPLLSDPRCVLFTDTRPEEILSKLMDYSMVGFSKTRLVAKPEIIRVHKEAYADFQIQLTNKLKLLSIMYGIKFSPIRQTDYLNQCKNLLRLAKSYGAGMWENQLTGMPVICVAAGPSLSGAIPALKQAGGRAVIVAADTAVKRLLQAGICPDIITTMDAFDRNYKNFEGIMDQLTRVPLIADMVSNPRIIQEYPGPIFFSNPDNHLIRYFQSSVPAFTQLKNNVSTALLNVSFAIKAGASSLILLGQDLAYDLEDWRSDSGKADCVFEQNGQWFMRRGDAQRGYTEALLTALPNTEGKTVYTHEEFLQIKQVLEETIRLSRIPAVNCTAGGLRLAGITHQPLSDVLSGLNEIWPIGQRIREIVSQSRQADTSEFHENARSLQSILATWEPILAEAAAILDRELAQSPESQVLLPAESILHLNETRDMLFSYAGLTCILEELLSGNIFVLQSRQAETLVGQPIGAPMTVEAAKTLHLVFYTYLQSTRILLENLPDFSL